MIYSVLSYRLAYKFFSISPSFEASLVDTVEAAQNENTQGDGHAFTLNCV